MATTVSIAETNTVIAVSAFPIAAAAASFVEVAGDTMTGALAISAGGLDVTGGIVGDTIDGPLGSVTPAAGVFTTLGSSGAAILDTGGTGSSFGGSISAVAGTFSGIITTTASSVVVNSASFAKAILDRGATTNTAAVDFRTAGAVKVNLGLDDDSTDNFHIGDDGFANKWVSIDTSTAAVTLTGILSVDDTTDSTSAITGSIHTDGGLGVAKVIVSGKQIRGWAANVGAPTFSTPTATDSGLFFSGSNPAISGSGTKVTEWNASGVFITGTITGSGILSVDDTTDSTSAITGSIHTDGGLGVAKALFVGGNLEIRGVGPHVIGGAAVDYRSLYIRGSFTSLGASTIAEGVTLDQTINSHSGDTTHVVGLRVISNIVNAAATTDIDQVQIRNPNISGAGTVVNASTVRILGAPTEGSSNNWALRVDSGLTSLQALTVGGTLQGDGFANIGTGSTVLGNQALRVTASLTDFDTDTSQYGGRFTPVFNSSATVFGYGHYVRADVDVGTAFTMADLAQLYVGDPGDFGSATVTREYGLFIEDMFRAGTSYAIKTGAGLVDFGGALTVGGDTSIANGAGLVVGAVAKEAFTDTTTELQVLGTSRADSSIALGRWSAGSASASLRFYHSRDTTIGDQTIVVTGDKLGEIMAYGDDGVDAATQSSAIIFTTEGTVGAGQIPGKIILQTAAAGALADVLTLDSAKLATFAGTINIAAIPTSDPGGSGNVWSNGGVLNIT